MSLKDSESRWGDRQGHTGDKIWEAPPQRQELDAIRSTESGISRGRRLHGRTEQISRQTRWVRDIPGRRNGMYKGKEL